MGQITKSASGVPAGKGTFKALVEHCAPQLQAVMPKGFKAERLVQMAVAAYSRTPKLAQCSNTSILSCCLQCATLGMEPSAVDGLGRAYILPYWNKNTKSYEAQFMLGKNGMIELARRSGEVKSIRTQCVYDDDDFEYWEDESGVHFSYRPNLDAVHDEKHMRLVFLSCHLKDGGLVLLVMSKPEIDAVRKRSQASNNGPWVTDYEAMAEKTVIRRAFNRGMLPRSVEVASAVAQDESTPVVIDSDGYEVFGQSDDGAIEVESTYDDAPATAAAPTPVATE